MLFKLLSFPFLVSALAILAYYFSIKDTGRNKSKKLIILGIFVGFVSVAIIYIIESTSVLQIINPIVLAITPAAIFLILSMVLISLLDDKQRL